MHRKNFIGKITKRTLSIVMSFLLLLTSININNFYTEALNTGYLLKEKEVFSVDENFVYNYETKTIVRYVGQATNIVVPSKISYNTTTEPILSVQDAPVEHIGDRAFIYDTDFNVSKIESVQIEEGIKTVGADAFNGNNISQVNLPSSIETIKEKAFYENQISSINFNLNSNLKTIEKEAFRNNLIMSLNTPDSLKDIGEMAFAQNKIQNITFNTGILSIGANAFEYNNLKTVKIPDDIQIYGENVFVNNGNYVNITGNSSLLKTYSVENGFGEIANPVSIIVKAIDKNTNLEIDKFILKTNVDLQSRVEELIALNNSVNIEAPFIEGYTTQEKISGTITSDNQEFIINYNKTTTDKPIISEFGDLIKTVGSTLTDTDIMKDVSAKDSRGNTITSSNIQVVKIQKADGTTVSGINDINMSVQGEYLLRYRATDIFGNYSEKERKLRIYQSIMDMETGNGWLYKDFEYSRDGSTITGFSYSGYAKVNGNKNIVFPSYSPYNPSLAITKIDVDSTIFYKKFEGKAITSVILPQKLEVIAGTRAFMNNAISDLNLPKTLKQIGEYAFTGNKITSINIGENLGIIEKWAFQNNKITELDIPETLTSIGERAFLNNNIRTLTLPNNMTSIGAGVFSRNNIEDIQIPDSVTSIGESAFSYNNISELDLSHLNLSIISGEAFRNNKIKALYLPENVQKIDYSAFAYNELEFAYVPDSVSNENLGEGVFGYNKIKSYRLPDNYTKISNNLFISNNIVNPSISENIRIIGIGAFESNLIEELNISPNLEEIGNNAFMRNTKLSKLNLGNANSLKSIGNYAFYDNIINADVLTIPSTVEKIGNYAFSNSESKNPPYPYQKLTYGIKSNIKELILNDIQTVGEGAFYGADISKLTIPQGVTSIAKEAFAQNRLEDIKTPESLKIINEGVFQENSLKNVVLSGETTDINNFAFYKNSISSINLPPTLKRIGTQAFSENALSSLYLPDSVVSIGGGAFSNNRLQSLRLSENITSIEGWTFYENRNLSTITIPNNIEEIKEAAFEQTNASTLNIDLDNSKLKTIGKSAFGYNKFIEVSLPKTVTSIQQDAFQNNNNNSINMLPKNRVAVYITDTSGNYYNSAGIQDTDISINSGHIINPAKLIIEKYDEDVPSKKITLDEVLLGYKIGNTYTIEPEKELFKYMISAPDTKSVTIDSKVYPVKFYYKEKTGVNMSNIKISAQHTSPLANKITGVTDNFGTREISGTAQVPIGINLDITGGTILENSKIIIDLEPKDAYKFLNVNISSHEQINGYKLENNRIVIDTKLLNQQTVQSGFNVYLSFKNTSPDNYLLDLTGRISIVTNAGEVLSTTDSSPLKAILVRYKIQYL